MVESVDDIQFPFSPYYIPRIHAVLILSDKYNVCASYFQEVSQKDINFYILAEIMSFVVNWLNNRLLNVCINHYVKSQPKQHEIARFG